MALVVKDRVKETTTTTGTGSVTLAGAATGFQTFNSAISVGNTTYYCIAGQGTSEWEVGVGTLSASTTLARTTVLSSSNSGSLVTFSAGTKDVFCTYPAAVAADTFGKNAIINGDFQIWQEGTSFAALASDTYPADLWSYIKIGTMVHTVSQSSDVPTIAEAGRKIPYSLLIDCTTADAAIAAGDICQIRNFVEGYNFVNIAGVGLCLQFWHKHTKTGIYCVNVSNSIADRSFVREYTQDVSDTWEFASVLVDASPTAGTWNYTTGIGLAVGFTLACGTNFQGTAGTWNSADDRATSNQVNACDNVANNFRLAGVQLEKGSVATEFDVRTFADELAACQRYFRVFGGNGNFEVLPGAGLVTTSSAGLFNMELSPSMRATPTVAVSAATDWNVNDSGTTAELNSFTLSGAVNSTTQAVELIWGSATATFVAGRACRISADNTSAARLTLSARF